MNATMVASEPGWYVVKAMQSEDSGLLVSARRVVAWDFISARGLDGVVVRAIAYDGSVGSESRGAPAPSGRRSTTYLRFMPDWREDSVVFTERGPHGGTPVRETEEERELEMQLVADAAARLELDIEERMKSASSSGNGKAAS